MTLPEAMDLLRLSGDPRNLEGMARFGIKSDNAFGTSVPKMRLIARAAGCDQILAEQLWGSGNREARILATFVAEPLTMKESTAEQWVRDLDSWDVCDAFCCDLIDRTPFAWRKVVQWSRRKEEFVRRAAFATMAGLARHDRIAPDARFERLFPLIARASSDDRNYVKKAVNWALRGVGKRNRALHKSAIATAREIRDTGTRSGRWIAADALRELENPKTIARIPR